VIPTPRPHVSALEPYQPGKPVEELERELGIQGAVKLASNENPVGPSPKALEAARAALATVNRYPEDGNFALRRRLAPALGVEPDELVFGAGADGILGLVGHAYLGDGDDAVFAWPSFAMYPILVRAAGARGIRVPLDAALVHDLDAMAAAITPATRVVFVCNPNNPTGTSVGRAAFDRFVERLPDDLLLVVDEAYREYARRPDFPDALAWARRRPGTLVLRTFSKIHGLAGLRVGYGVAQAELVSLLDRVRHPFHVNAVAQAAAVAALDDAGHVATARRVNDEGLAWLERELTSLGVRTWPSDANFLLAEAGAGVHEALLREGVIVRPLAGFGLPDHIRVSVGLPAENERFVKALRRLREGRR